MNLAGQNTDNGDELVPMSSLCTDEGKRSSFDTNTYTITKTITNKLLNVALITTNSKQLRATIDKGPVNNPFYGTILAFAILSITLQATMCILGVFLGSKDIKQEENKPTARKINTTLVILGIITVIINVLLASFSG